MKNYEDYEIKTRYVTYRGFIYNLDENDDQNEILLSYDKFIYSILTKDRGKKTLVVITEIKNQKD